MTRGAPQWRPLRGPLSKRSIDHNMTVVAGFMKRLLEAGYLSANPCAFLPRHQAAGTQLDDKRSFNKEHHEAIRFCLARLPDDAWIRRLRAALLLLQTTGLRIGEAAAARHEDLVRRDPDGSGEHMRWELEVVGEGNRSRTAIVLPDVYEARVQHYRDRRTLVHGSTAKKLRLPSAYAPTEDPTGPLLGLLQNQRRLGESRKPGFAVADTHQPLNLTGALSVRGLHDTIKKFFAQVASTITPGTGASFRAASAHWLRHTFAKDALAATDGDLNAVRRALGHASINTTTIYTTNDAEEQFEALRNIVRLA